jgi:hypothetical protein
MGFIKSSWVKIIRPLSFVLLFFVLCYLGYRAYFGLKTLINSGVSFKPTYLILSFVCHLSGYFLAAGLWGDIIKKFGAQSDYGFDFLAFSVSAIGRKIPGIVVYAIGRLMIYSAIKVSKKIIAISMVVEIVIYSISGVICLVLSSGTTLPIKILNNQQFLIICAIFSIILFTWLAPKIINIAMRATKNQIEQINNNNPFGFYHISLWILLGIIVTILSSATVFFVFKSIQLPSSIPFSPVLSSFGLSFLLGPLAVWVPSDIGLRDGIMYFFIKNWTDPSMAALLTLASRIWISISEITIGLISAYFLNKRIKLNTIVNEIK